MRLLAVFLLALLSACRGQTDSEPAAAPSPPAPELPSTATWMPKEQGKLEIREVSRTLTEPGLMLLELEVTNASPYEVLDWSADATFVTTTHRVVGTGFLRGTSMAPRTKATIPVYVPVDGPEEIAWNQYKVLSVQIVEDGRMTDLTQRFVMIFEPKANPLSPAQTTAAQG